MKQREKKFEKKLIVDSQNRFNGFCAFSLHFPERRSLIAFFCSRAARKWKSLQMRLKTEQARISLIKFSSTLKVHRNIQIKKIILTIIYITYITGYLLPII